MLEILRNESQAHRSGWDWEELRQSALSTSLQVLRSRHDAEDAAQEAILRAWRAQARCKGTECPVPWIGRIARNEALRLGARLSVRQRAEGVGLEDVCQRVTDGSAPSGVTPETAVLDAVGNLRGSEAELVRLRYVEDLEYSTIAERLDLPLGTVKVRLHRLHTRLRKAKEREGIPGDF